MIIEIRKLLYSRLKASHPRVYFLKAPESAVFPYIVYSFEITTLEDGLNLLTIDVNGWDNSPDTIALETMMAKVHEQFNNDTIITSEMVISFHVDRRMTVEDDDPTLNRRTNIYLGRLFER